MIVEKLGTIDLNSDLYDEKIKKALKYLQNTDLLNLENGKYEIEGDDLFAIVQDYQTKPTGKWEAHKKYIDIQYVVKGCEKIGYGEIAKFSAISKYDIEKDIFFLEGDGEFKEIKEGFFAIITPEYAHIPNISINQRREYVKKVVIKVKK